MTAELMTLDIRTRREWRTWLQRHHVSSRGIWLTFYKGHTGVESVSYEDSVREALCFGWVDSLIKRLDDRRYARKFTPRKPTSKWSDSNRKRWSQLKADGLLSASGLAAAPTEKTYAPRPHTPGLPAYIAKALRPIRELGASSRSWRPPTGVTLWLGFIRRRGRKRAPGASANRSPCSPRDKSWA
jgi:hypothetical protein